MQWSINLAQTTLLQWVNRERVILGWWQGVQIPTLEQVNPAKETMGAQQAETIIAFSGKDISFDFLYLKAFRQGSGICSLSNFFKESRKPSTLPIITFAAFQLLSFGILPPGAVKIITAAVTLTTASGGEPKDFSSVRLLWKGSREDDSQKFSIDLDRALPRKMYILDSRSATALSNKIKI